MSVRVNDGFNCSNLNECRYNNGGCQQNCHDQVNGYRCSCNQGYILTNNNHTCISSNSGFTLNTTISNNLTVNCDYDNGDCEHICLRENTTYGFYDYCSCYKGYKIANSSLDCVDIDECKANLLICLTPEGYLGQCLNTYGSFVCVKIFEEGPGFLRNALSEAQHSETSAQLQTENSPASQSVKKNTASNLVHYIYYGLIIWIALISLSLVILIYVNHRLSRRDDSVRKVVELNESISSGFSQENLSEAEITAEDIIAATLNEIGESEMCNDALE